MRIEDLSFRYGDKQIFSDLSLVIPDDGACIMGPSGRGKTTLLFLIGGLLIPEKGIIEPKPQRPAFVFQEDRLLPWYPVLKNVTVVNKNAGEERALQILDALEIPPDMKTDELSGGMKRRVALARALYYEGDMLFLDEPFKGLDAILREMAAGLILREHKPFIITTHQMEEAEMLKIPVIDI